MHKSSVEHLFNTYPRLFTGKNRSIQESLMPFGMECGNGWFWLLNNLCVSIQSYIDNNGIDQVEFTQIKERFGRLWVHENGCDDVIFGMILMAENMSKYICEICGSTENVTSEGSWVRTLCNKCRDK